VALALTLSKLAELVNGSIVRGDPATVYSGMAALDTAGPEDVSFFGNDKYRAQFETARAGAVIVAQGESGGPQEVALVAVDNPTMAVSAVISHFSAAARPFEPGIHPKASVDSSAKVDPAKVKVHAGAVIMESAVVGDGTEIGPNVVVYPEVVIGRDCRIYANVTIREKCSLGDRVILQPGVVVGSDGYGYQFKDGRHMKIDQVGVVEIGDDVEIGSNTTIDRARFGKTVVGEGTKIDNQVQLGHNVVVGMHCLIIAQSGIAGSSHLGDYVTVAAQVGVAGHVKVGDKAVLGARTGVTQSLEGGKTYLGNPAVPMMEEQKCRALVRRLPEIVKDLRELKKRGN
jgi:UDP-3-O-[3-hydroxymyristoyl] glucosamine N-acyltransferase